MEIKKDPTLLCDRDTNEQSCQVDPQDCQRQITNTYTLFYYPHIKAFPIFHREKHKTRFSHPENNNFQKTKRKFRHPQTRFNTHHNAPSFNQHTHERFAFTS